MPGKLRFILLFFLFSGYAAFSQISVRDSSITTPMFYATFSYQWPFGDLSERYGSRAGIGGGFMVKSSGNWIFGAEGNYYFGGTVKNSDSILKALQTPEGFMIDENGFYGDVLFSERGFDFSVKTGKILPVLSPNPNSGIMIMAGLGYTQNKIRIHAVESSMPSIENDYRKGYDRLNGGFFLSASAGYLLMSNSRLLNFSIAGEFRQAWTTAKRDYDFESGMKDNKSYSSQYFGLRVKWMIPLYPRKPSTYYLY